MNMKNPVFTPAYAASLLVISASAATLALTACGGGGSSTTTVGTTTTTTTITGVVSEGQAVAGASVSAKCVSGGSSAAAKTDASGAYTLNLPHVTAPCLIEATGGTVGSASNTQTLHGYAPAAGVAHLNLLTDWALSKALGQSVADAYAAGFGNTTASSLSNNLADAKSWINAQLSSLGIAPPTADILSGAFSIGDTTDLVQDALAKVMSDQGKTLADLSAGAAQNQTATQTLGNKTTTIQFAAYNGSTPVTCGSSLTLGTSSKAVKVQDMRFYVSNINLVKTDGSKVRLTLNNTADNYNYDNGTNAVSLIDLEDKSGSCAGSTSTNSTVVGTVPAGRYTGVELEVGVPFAFNHFDSTASTTPAVLQSSVQPGMAWNWRGGRKFTKIELAQDTNVDSTAWPNGNDTVLLHLGSTGCLAADPTQAVSSSNMIASCKAPNRLPLSFASFDPSRQTIALDVAALFNFDIASDAIGCMSGATDASCTKLFSALALNFDAPTGNGTGLPVSGQTQVVFKAVTQ